MHTKQEKQRWKALYIQANQPVIISKTIKILNRQSLLTSYGHVANVRLPLWKNTEDVLSRMTTFSYFNRPQQMSYHDLCSEDSPPKGIGVTLGLGLKFCIQSLKPPPHFNNSFDRFTDDLRKKYLFAGSIQMEEIERKIYIKSDFIPDRMDQYTKDRLSNFINTLSSIKKQHQLLSTPSTNLTYIQQQHIKYLRNNK
jgi:hypothetical protein